MSEVGHDLVVERFQCDAYAVRSGVASGHDETTDAEVLVALGYIEVHRRADGDLETRIAAGVRSPGVLVVGHPFIDIWAAVRPSAVGIRAWPDVPPGQPWKEGVLRAIGWPPEVPAAWQRILRSVTSYADLEPELLGRVEELIDFVTTPGSA